MADSWQTKHIPLKGGLITNMPRIQQGMIEPGSCISGINFEPGESGGYRRITGYTEYDSTAITGTGEVLGAFVFNGNVIGMRGTEVYKSAGAGWTKINGAATRTNAKKYRAAIYNWVGNTISFVDSQNYPAKWDGTTYTELTNAPIGAQHVIAHQNHLWFAKGPNLTFSKPNDDTVYTAADGAGIINVGTDITGLGSWRDTLYVFSKNRIQKIEGTSKINFALRPVTEELGCVNGDSIAEIGGDLLFLGPDGVRTVAGTDRIGDVELGNLSDAVGDLVDDMGPTYESGSISSVIVREKSQYRLFGAKTADPEETAFGVLGGLHESSQGHERHEKFHWEWFELQGIKVACAHSDYISGVEYVIHGGYDGKVYRQEFGNDFNGSNVVAHFSIPYITYDDPRLRKVLHRLDAFIEAEGANDVRINFTLDYDDPSIIQPPQINVLTTTSALYTYGDPGSKYGTAVYDTPTEVARVHSLVGSCFNHSITVSSNDTNPPYTLTEFLIEYSLKGRR